jgi:hypothetical protein
MPTPDKPMKPATLKGVRAEETETPDEEASESPEEQDQELENGTEIHNNAGVTVSEDFQKKAHHLVHKATRHELRHLSDKISSRHEELAKEEEETPQKGKAPKVYSSEGMPE